MVALLEVESDEEYKIAIELFKEYVAQINVDLSFQNFDREIKDIKYQYSRPNGVLIIGYDMENKAIGCFGIRRFADSICELKRMYLRKEVRGLGWAIKCWKNRMKSGKN
jgi:hypothetical protein